MALIRTIQASQGISVGGVPNTRVDDSVGQGLSQLGNAVTNAVNVQTELDMRRERMKMEMEGFKQEQAFTRLGSENALDFATAQEGIDPSGDGFTENISGLFNARSEAFMKDVPDALKPKFSELLKTSREQWVNKAAAAEIDQRRTWYETGVTDRVKVLQGQVFNDPGMFDAAKEDAYRNIDASGMSPVKKEEWRRKTDELLATTVGEREIRDAEANPALAGQAASRLGVPGAGGNAVSIVVDRIIGVESNGDASAQNPRSSAGGVGQFIDSTWVATVRKYRPDLSQGKSNDDIIELKSNGALGREMTTRHVEENAQLLRQSGNAVTPANLYLMHFAGQGGAPKLLSASDDTPVSDVLDANAIRANPTVLGAGKTVGDVKRWAEKKMASSPSQPSNLPDISQANSFLKTRLVNHGPDHIDGMQPEMQQRLAAMFQAAPPAIAAKLGIFSGARTVARQTELWNNALKKYGSAGEARKWVAPPPGVSGSKGSNHNHGSAADLSYNGQSLSKAPTEVVKWVHDNAEQFGLKFPLGNENWHVELASTRGGTGAAASAVPTDQRYASLPLEKRLEIYDKIQASASRGTTVINAQATAAYDSHKGSIELGIQTGDVASPQTILSDQILTDAHKADLVSALRSRQGENMATGDAMRLFSEGNLNVDPYDPKGKKTVDGVWDNVSKAIPPEQLQPTMENLVRQTGTVPQQAVNMIRRGLNSPNVQEIVAAAQAAQRVSSIDPAALGRRDGGGEAQTAADDFSFYTNKLNLSPEDAARRLADARSPEKKFDRKALEPAAKEFLKDAVKTDISSVFDDGVFSSSPEVGQNPQQAAGIQAEYLAIAEDQFYAANGDPALAKNRAIEEMKRLYGVSDFFGTKTIVKHPPEKYWPGKRDTGGLMGFGASDPFQYAKDQLTADIKAAMPGLSLPEVYSPSFAGTKGGQAKPGRTTTDMSSVQLVTTPETDAMVKRGEMPAYAVVWKDANGVLQTLPGKLWRPDISGVQVENQQSIDAEKNARVENAQQLNADIVGGRDRGATLDNFIDGPMKAPPPGPVAPPAAPVTPRSGIADQRGELMDAAKNSGLLTPGGQ